MRSADPATGSGAGRRDRLLWMLVGALAIAAIGWMGYQATLSRFNALLLALLSAVVALLVGSIAAISWGRRTTRRASEDRRLLAPALAALVIGWFGFAVALFVAFSFLEAQEVLHRFFAR